MKCLIMITQTPYQALPLAPELLARQIHSLLWRTKKYKNPIANTTAFTWAVQLSNTKLLSALLVCDLTSQVCQGLVPLGQMTLQTLNLLTNGLHVFP